VNVGDWSFPDGFAVFTGGLKYPDPLLNSWILQKTAKNVYEPCVAGKLDKANMDVNFGSPTLPVSMKQGFLTPDRKKSCNILKS
jgi:hypothetical protein